MLTVLQWGCAMNLRIFSGRELVSAPVPVDASAEEFETLLKALPTVPGGLSVSREVSRRLTIRETHGYVLYYSSSLSIYIGDWRDTPAKFCEVSLA